MKEKVMASKTYGLMGVDWEERVNFERLRTERLARITRLLKESEMGALLCFDMTNVRYITATHIGTWAMDKLARLTLQRHINELLVCDFGPPARHHHLYWPRVQAGSLPVISTVRGAILPEAGRAEHVPRKIQTPARERSPSHGQ